MNEIILIIDTHTGVTRKIYPSEKRLAARRYAEKLNQDYGAVRFTTRMDTGTPKLTYDDSF